MSAIRHDTFNADFYVVAATVIPILYLALTLQGQTFERIAARYAAYNRRILKEGQSRSWVTTYALYIPALVIIFGGLWGEGLSIKGLYDRSQSNAPLILIIMYVLIIAVVAAPAYRFAEAFFGPFSEPAEIGEEKKDGPHGESPSPE